MVVKVGVVGCGRWGRNLIRVFNELSDSNLVACCNLNNEERLNNVKGQYPHVKTTHNLDDILRDEDIDAVVVATPDETHFNIGMEALRSNKHVFIEKPLALTLEEASELVATAEDKKRILIAGHVMLYHPAIQKIKQRLQTHKIKCIQSTRLDSERSRPGSDLIWSSVIHDVSIINYLIERETLAISSIGTSLNKEKPYDMVFVNIMFSDTIIANIYASFVGPGKKRELIVYSEDETITFDGSTGKLATYARRGGEKALSIGDGEPLKIECQDFLDCINSGVTPLAGGGNTLQVMTILKDIEESLNISHRASPL